MTTGSDVRAVEQSENTGLSESDRHRVLSVERRRIALDVLAEQRSPLGLWELAEAVAERESERGEVDDDDVEQVAITLHHNHLPGMAELGVVDYDPCSKRVESATGLEPAAN
jgi:hypothetical protein